MWSSLVSGKLSQWPTSEWVSIPAVFWAADNKAWKSFFYLCKLQHVPVFQGDVMFRNWRSVFSGDGARIHSRIPIYSFDGRDVLADPFWSVNSVYCLNVLYFFLASFPQQWRFPFFLGQASEEHLAWLHQQGSQSGGQTLRDVASRWHVRHRPVIQPDLGTAPGPADAKLFQRVHRPLHRDPQEPLTHPRHST